MGRLGHWIGGEPVADDAGRLGEVFDPATGAATCEVAFADAATVGPPSTPRVRRGTRPGGPRP